MLLTEPAMNSVLGEQSDNNTVENGIELSTAQDDETSEKIDGFDVSQEAADAA